MSGHLFGMPIRYEDALIGVIPAPFGLTVSGRSGTHLAPQSILEASSQVDYGIWGYRDAWRTLACMLPEDACWQAWTDAWGERVAAYWARMARSEVGDTQFLRDINHVCEQARAWVKKQVGFLLKEKKVPVILGGEHGISLGAIQSLCDYYGGKDLGILQVDAHMDLHAAYGGMRYSHASVMHAVMCSTEASLVQVGIRAFAACEQDFALRHGSRIKIFYQEAMDAELARGILWEEICMRIVEALPLRVYLSIDVDGLEGFSCGTPVMNGLSVGRFLVLLRAILKAKKQIVGGDLVEFIPTKDFSAQYKAAQLLYRLCVGIGSSQRCIGAR